MSVCECVCVLAGLRCVGVSSAVWKNVWEGAERSEQV